MKISSFFRVNRHNLNCSSDLVLLVPSFVGVFRSRDVHMLRYCMQPLWIQWIFLDFSMFVSSLGASTRCLRMFVNCSLDLDAKWMILSPAFKSSTKIIQNQKCSCSFLLLASTIVETIWTNQCISMQRIELIRKSDCAHGVIVNFQRMMAWRTKDTAAETENCSTRQNTSDVDTEHTDNQHDRNCECRNGRWQRKLQTNAK